MKFLPKKFHENVQILDKNCSFVPKNVHLVLKKQKKFTFCIKNEVFAKEFHQNKKFTFCIKNEVFAKEFHQNVQILDKNCSFVPKNIYLIL